MKKRLTRNWMILVMVSALTVLLVKVVTSPSYAVPSNAPQERIASVNAKAQRTSADEPAIRELTDEIFHQLALPEVEVAASTVKDRLVRAELEYRSNHGGGVSERKLVNAFNKLARELDLPDYARVSLTQVRYMRVQLVPAFPTLMAQPKQRSQMSPLEATILGLVLVTQKLSNEDFQVAPEEWTKQRHQREVARWQAYRNGDDVPKSDVTAKTRLVVENSKTRHIKQAVEDHALEMPVLIDELLTGMGIPR